MYDLNDVKVIGFELKVTVIDGTHAAISIVRL